MPKLFDPILGPDGKRLYVVTQEHIGAEEINAACEWTQRVYKGFTREHSEGGMHNRGFQALGAIEFLMPRWMPGEVRPGRIYRAELEDIVVEDGDAKNPILINPQPSSPGLFSISWDPGFYKFPSLQYFVTVAGAPHPIGSGVRRFQFIPSSRAYNGFQLRADGNPITFAREGHNRVPLLAVIFGASR